LILLVSGGHILTWILKNIPQLDHIVNLILLLRYAVLTAYLFFVLFGLYFILPGTRQRVRDALPGTLFALSSWILTSWAFSFYVDRLADYATIYGSLGTIIMLLSWLYLINMILLLGAHINATFRIQKDSYND
jgi:membrane protein